MQGPYLLLCMYSKCEFVIFKNYCYWKLYFFVVFTLHFSVSCFSGGFGITIQKQVFPLVLFFLFRKYKHSFIKNLNSISLNIFIYILFIYIFLYLICLQNAVYFTSICFVYIYLYEMGNI